MSSSRDDASQRIGLDYLFESKKMRKQPPESASEPDPVVNSTAQAFAGKTILEAIQRLENDKGDQGVRLSDVAEETGMSAVLLLPMARRLEKGDLLEVLDRTSFGDDSVRLTPFARKLLDTDLSTLMEHLGLT